MTDWRDNLTWYTSYETPFVRLAKRCVGPILYGMAPVECAGFEIFPVSGPCIVAANHFSSWDVPYMGLCLPRFPHFMAKKELYKNPVLGWMFRQLGSFPVTRGVGDTWAMTKAGQVLAAGQVLFLFPEGTRGHHKAEVKQGKSGVVKLALRYGAPVVPTAIWGTENFKIGWKRNYLHICTGAPMDMVALAGPPPYNAETSRRLTALMMQKIAEMLPPEYRGAYA
jgi:1-acyl-sn-glycerol-3-phosphate acyltransferase